MKKTSILQILSVLLVILVLTACGGNKEADSGTSPELPEDAESLVMLAKFDLTLKTGVDIEEITTKSPVPTQRDATSAFPSDHSMF